eukprot:COSAG05_NODE_2301_length_3253_cov_2.449905_4_plen_67_part_00
MTVKGGLALCDGLRASRHTHCHTHCYIYICVTYNSAHHHRRAEPQTRVQMTTSPQNCLTVITTNYN